MNIHTIRHLVFQKFVKNTNLHTVVLKRHLMGQNWGEATFSFWETKLFQRSECTSSCLSWLGSEMKDEEREVLMLQTVPWFHPPESYFRPWPAQLLDSPLQADVWSFPAHLHAVCHAQDRRRCNPRVNLFSLFITHNPDRSNKKKVRGQINP